MNYSEALDYLKASLTFGIRLGLHRMNRLLDLLGHPETGHRVIHIAGTNGKGSTTVYCASILAAEGFRVGVYTSPYIERFTERIRVIDGQTGLDRLAVDETCGEIGPDHFAAIMSEIRQAVDQMLAQGEEHPTEFEMITAAAFMLFSLEKCDWIVLETGLGGRLDSTNVIDRPAQVIITALGYDHMDRLGQTLPEIAAEKAGIIKAGCPVILYDPVAATPDHLVEAVAARQVIIERCQTLGSPLTILHPSMVETLDYHLEGQTFRYCDEIFQTRLLGLFQPLNAALAIQTCRQLASPRAIESGIRQTRWPARLEVFQTDPMILIDGAHNPQGCSALGDALDRLLPGQPIVFLVGLLADKDYPAMMTALWSDRCFNVQSVICVTPDNPRALPASQLARHIVELKINQHSGYNISDMIHTFDQPDQGLSQAVAIAVRSNATVCAFGSLYLVGHLRSWIRNRQSRYREDPLI